MSSGLTFREFVAPLVWLDGRPLRDVIEPYRWRLFNRAFERDTGRPGLAYVKNLILDGRSKKNFKTADEIVAELFGLMDDSVAGNQVYHVANDEDQAGDALELAKKLVRANPILHDWLTIRKNVVERRDGRGFIEILPGRDAVGSHGKTFRFLGIDEIHGYRDWDLLEALAPDPTRHDAQTWITSYASVHHRPGAPLFDLLQQAKAGADPRMLFSWYAADYCTDPEFADRSPEQRANPSMASWDNPGYLEQQRRRLPAHKYRRLHLNLPGVPEGSAFAPEPVMEAVERGVKVRPPVAGVAYVAFVDMSGGSSDDAVLGIGHRDGQGRAVLDCLQDQGSRPPFDPNAAVDRFVRTLRSYGVARVTGDRYAGETFVRQFEARGVGYAVSERSKSELYEALEPPLNARQVVLLDVPEAEQQLLGLIWRGGRIDHPAGEHDDHANACAGVVAVLVERPCPHCDDSACDGQPPFGLMGSPEVAAWFQRHPDLDERSVGTTGSVGKDEADSDPAERELWERLSRWHRLAEAGDPDADAAEAEIEAFVAAQSGPEGERLRGILRDLQQEEPTC